MNEQINKAQGAPLKSSENQTQKTRSELAIAEDRSWFSVSGFRYFLRGLPVNKVVK